MLLATRLRTLELHVSNANNSVKQSPPRHMNNSDINASYLCCSKKYNCNNSNGRSSSTTKNNSTSKNSLYWHRNYRDHNKKHISLYMFIIS